MPIFSIRRSGLLLLAVFAISFFGGCSSEPALVVPRQENWGIYFLDLTTKRVELIYSDSKQISGLDLDTTGNRLAFSLREGAAVLDTSSEIYSIAADGTGLRRLTDNDYFDAYPSFSPDGSKIVFLSKRNGTLDLYIMDAGGSTQRRLYDSGEHDGDVNWGRNGYIVFTRTHQIWLLDPDGTNPRQVTNPPDAGQWGSANLPIGDYDPRLHPDGSRIVFERLEDPNKPHGGYNLFVVNIDGTGENRLTDNGYTQGMPSWSHSGGSIVYVVSAIEGIGQFEMYMINADGTNNHNITPDYFPDTFLVHQALFSSDDLKIFFVAEWWR